MNTSIWKYAENSPSAPSTPHNHGRRIVAHVRPTRRNPYPCAARNGDHALSSRNAAASRPADVPFDARIVAPRISMTSMSERTHPLWTAGTGHWLEVGGH